MKWVLAHVVDASYWLMSLAMVHIIVQAYVQKSYGMPPLSTIVMMAIAALCGFIGPWYQPHLFFPATDTTLVWLWRGWFVAATIAYVQWVVWRERQETPWPELQRWLPLLSLVAFFVALGGAYAFVVFYQDYYVNEISPIGMLLVAIGYLGTLFQRPRLYGLSILVGWYWFISNTMLYGATILGGMDKAYCDATHGYAFMYWVFALTLALNLSYAVLLTAWRRKLAPDYPSRFAGIGRSNA